MDGRVAQLHRSIRTARRMTLGLVEHIPHEQWTLQPVPGMNHVSWTLMHLLIAEDWGPTALGDPRRPWGEIYDVLVGRGPVPDGWPEPDAILAALEASHARFLHALSGISDADLDRETSGAIAEYAPTLGTVLDSHIWHEGFHCGQLSVIRKSLALPPRFG